MNVIQYASDFSFTFTGDATNRDPIIIKEAMSGLKFECMYLRYPLVSKTGTKSHKINCFFLFLDRVPLCLLDSI